MPSLVRWRQEVGPEFFSMMTVFSDSSKQPELVQQYIDKHQVTFPILSEQSSNLERHGVKGFPSAFFLDTRGKVIWQGILPRASESNDDQRPWLDRLLRQAGVEPPPIPIRWLEYDEGVEESERTSKTRLIFIEANRCGQSTRIERLLTQDDEIAGLLHDYIRIKIDGRSQLEIVKKYRASWPGDLLIIDASDQLLYRFWDHYKDIPAFKKALYDHAN
ncbi:MAG: thioredoxin family protein [Planctomycetota bacterium]|nr:thioredoxin family protein [Planctomycetota bacterium]